MDEPWYVPSLSDEPAMDGPGVKRPLTTKKLTEEVERDLDRRIEIFQQLVIFRNRPPAVAAEAIGVPLQVLWELSEDIPELKLCFSYYRDREALQKELGKGALEVKAREAVTLTLLEEGFPDLLRFYLKGVDPFTEPEEFARRMEKLMSSKLIADSFKKPPDFTGKELNKLRSGSKEELRKQLEDAQERLRDYRQKESAAKSSWKLTDVEAEEEEDEG